jgi:hypothetical protein
MWGHANKQPKYHEYHWRMLLLVLLFVPSCRPCSFPAPPSLLPAVNLSLEVGRLVEPAWPLVVLPVS